MGRHASLVQDARGLHKELMRKARWQEGSQTDLFLTAAQRLGYSNAPLAWGLSKARWDSKEDLITFLDALTMPTYDQGGESIG